MIFIDKLVHFKYSLFTRMVKSELFLGKKTIFILFLFLIVSIILSSYFYLQYRSTKKLLESKKNADSSEAEKLIAKISQYMVLPSEAPTLASVSDKEKLKNQAFFKDAENGDKVLIYRQARKAILYRPSINKIVEVAPINLGDQAGSTASASVSKNSSIRVAIYNGTKIAGLASSTENDLRGKISSIKIVEKGNAANDYSKSVVVDISGRNKKTAEEIAKVIGAEIGSKLPDGEKKPEADILIILGR